VGNAVGRSGDRVSGRGGNGDTDGELVSDGGVGVSLVEGRGRSSIVNGVDSRREGGVGVAGGERVGRVISGLKRREKKSESVSAYSSGENREEAEKNRGQKTRGERRTMTHWQPRRSISCWHIMEAE
jgi:hypothetical protein